MRPPIPGCGFLVLVFDCGDAVVRSVLSFMVYLLDECAYYTVLVPGVDDDKTAVS
jgi:hypothetical protein